MSESRITRRFAALRSAGRAGLITFITAGDPDHETSYEIMRGLPGAGADVIELGMPFTDPMADGPSIQASGLRALRAGATMHGTLALVRRFRAEDDATPIVLMGYYNPIYIYGRERFLADALDCGVDGIIVVDLPPEEDTELCLPAIDAGLHFIRLATPTTDERRLPKVLTNTSGFLYYVSVAGITGAKSPELVSVAAAVDRLHRHTDLPIAVGFGIKSTAQTAAIAEFAEAAVVGSALVDRVGRGLDENGRPRAGLVDDVLSFVDELAAGARQARKAVA